MPDSDRDLKQDLERELGLHRLVHQQSDDVKSLTQSAIRDLIIEGALSREKVAEKLKMPTWTLGRRLRDLNSSYSVLVEQTRRNLALDLLKKKQTTVTEIAFLLGYADSSSFTRAVHRWTSMNPREYRFAHSDETREPQ